MACIPLRLLLELICTCLDRWLTRMQSCRLAYLVCRRVGQGTGVDAPWRSDRALFQSRQQVTHSLVIPNSRHEIPAMLQELRPGVVHQDIQVHPVHCGQPPRFSKSVLLQMPAPDITVAPWLYCAKSGTLVPMVTSGLGRGWTCEVQGSKKSLIEGVDLSTNLGASLDWLTLLDVVFFYASQMCLR